MAEVNTEYVHISLSQSEFYALSRVLERAVNRDELPSELDELLEALS